MIRPAFIFFLIAPLMFASCSTRPAHPLPTVAKVDLPRYAGKWHEVARLPMVFQKGCVRSTAEYTLKDEGAVQVVNRCLKNGKTKQVRGTAEVVDAETNAILEVRFDEWFSVFIPRAKNGNYFVVWLAKDYSAAAVGTPSRKALWILSRDPKLSGPRYAEIVAHCRSLGFPVEDLIVDAEQEG